MTPVQILFILVAAVTLGSALLVVTVRNLIHSALWLILSLFGIAIFYVLLDAGFLAIAQVVIYIGAIAILMIFAIMMTRNLAKNPGKQNYTGWGAAGLMCAALFGGLSYMLNQWPQFTDKMPALSYDPLAALGTNLVSPAYYALPFEVASVLLLAALVGAIMIARERK